jgi:hypothetical protein
MCVQIYNVYTNRKKEKRGCKNAYVTNREKKKFKNVFEVENKNCF